MVITIEKDQTKNPSLKNEALRGWFSRGKLLPIEGNSIFCIDEGSENKPVVVLIHGFPTASFDFQQIWESLLSKYRLVTLDMLGFGFSDKPNQRDYTIAKQANLFERYLSDLGIRKFHVLAHDYGVSVAQELIHRNNQLDNKNILSCCFVNGGLFPETHKALLIQKVMLSPLGKWVNSFAGFRQFSRSFSSVFGHETKPSENELREFWELIKYNHGKHVFHNLITYIQDRRDNRDQWLSALQNAPMPLALINGLVDPVSGEHLIDRYQELNCRLDYLARLQDIGHYPQVEAPHEVSQCYLDFLASIT